MILTPLIVHSLSAPASIRARAKSRSLIPPEALIFRFLPKRKMVSLIISMSCIFAPLVEKPVDVFIKSALFSQQISLALMISSSVSRAVSMITLSMADLSWHAFASM